jgi:hypothetical protein
MSNNVFQRSAATTVLLAVAVPVSAKAWSALAAPALRRAWSSPGRSDPLVEDLLAAGCAVALGVVWLWLVTSTLVCLTDALDPAPAGHPSLRGTVFRPRFLRALVALALGSAVVVAGTAAADPGSGGSLPSRLDGLRLPDRPVGGVRTHRVTDGESLWSVTAARLPRGPGPAAVADAWPRLYELNHRRIGADPDLVPLDTVLRLPASWALRTSARTRGETR